MNLRRLAKDDQGSLMLEFIICMPAYMLLLFGCVQFAHLWMGRQVVHYAAYSAARSALVSAADPGGERPNWDGGRESDIHSRSTAIRVTQWLGIGDGSTLTGANAHLPGWGNVLASNDAANRTTVTTEFDEWNVGATVTYEFPLVTPIVGPIIAATMASSSSSSSGPVWNMDSIIVINPPGTGSYLDPGKAAAGEFPRMTLSQTVWLPKPYRSVMARGK